MRRWDGHGDAGRSRVRVDATDWRWLMLRMFGEAKENQGKDDAGTEEKEEDAAVRDDCNNRKRDMQMMKKP